MRAHVLMCVEREKVYERSEIMGNRVVPELRGLGFGLLIFL